MSKLFKLSFVIVLLLLSNACEDGFLDINTDPTRTDNANVLVVMPGAQAAFVSALLTNVNYAPMAYSQQLTTTSFFNNAFSRYVADGASFATGWNDLYTNSLPDLDFIINNAQEQGFTSLKPIAMLQKAYIYSAMVDLWGDIPFSEAVKSNENFNPAFESGEQIYPQLLNMIDEAITLIGQETGDAPSASDIIYGGDLNKWVKMGNTLKLKLLVQTRLINNTASQIETLLATPDNLITSNEEDFQFQFGASQSPENRHPLYALHYQPGKTYFMNNYFISLLRFPNEGTQVGPEATDPRLRYYIYRQTNVDPDPGTSDFPCSGVPNCNFGYQGDGYIARDGGTEEIIGNDGATRSTFGVYPIGGSFDSDKFNIVGLGDGAQGRGIFPMLTNFMVKFLQAEAVLELEATGDARVLLEEGMRASISKVMDFGAANTTIDAAFAPSDEDVNVYIAAVLSDYDAAADDSGRLDVIMEQMHIALFGNGIETWNNYRRTGFPSSMPQAVFPLGDFPLRLLYSVDELNTNSSINTQTSQQTKIFWDN